MPHEPRSAGDPPASLSRRIAAAAGLSAYFLAVYPACLWVAGRRSAVPSFYFAWERHVPFVPLSIVPYLSVDLFFVTAPLLVTTVGALRAYVARVAVAIAVAAACFLAVPLRFAFDRPPLTGAVGYVFERFAAVDRPFNTLPSLHIATLLIAGDVFVRRTRGAVRAVLVGWFVLIAVSPLLTYQHHLTDLLAGGVLGLLCLRLIDGDPRPAFGRNGRVGGYYAAAGVALLAASVALGKGGWPLWWPTLSLLLAAAAYLAVGPALYGKRDGRVGWASRLLLGPVLLGQHASLRWYARRARPYDAVTDRLWIGRRLSAGEAAAARAAGVVAVVDLTCEFTEPAPFRSLPYLPVATLDLTAPTPAQVARAVAFIAEHEPAGVVYVHCKAGYSRTAVVAAAYLLATGKAATPDEAVARLRRARPSLVVRPEAARAVRLAGAMRQFGLTGLPAVN